MAQDPTGSINVYLMPVVAGLAVGDIADITAAVTRYSTTLELAVDSAADVVKVGTTLPPTGTTISVVATSDVHGNVLNFDYGTNAAPSKGQGLAKVSTYVKGLRVANPNNVMLIDNGDTIQGTPLVYYYNMVDKTTTYPMAAVMGAMEYDTWTLGNHEFNYGLDTLNRIMTDADRVPNVNGWYNSDVTFALSATDSLSGLARVDTSVTVNTEGVNQLIPGTATDNAGNVGYPTTTVNIDKTAPVVTVNGIKDSEIYILNQSVPVSWSATDDISGLDNTKTAATVPSGNPIDTKSIGTKQFTVTATDNAGNTTTKNITYTVVYKFGGILQPINPDGSGSHKLGSTIPVKFQLTDANNISVSTVQATLFYAKVTNNVLGDTYEAISTGKDNTGNYFRYDGNQYSFNLSTKNTGFTTGTYQITIVLDDKTTQTVRITLR